MPRLCEACELTDAQIVEPCDCPDEPYHLCPVCHHRLRARSLRPLEWYNLAKRYGWYQFLLHDDFYDENGAASQPEEDVERPQDFPVPSLASLCHDPIALLDYSITRWHFKSEVASAWRSIPRSTILDVLSERFMGSSNVGIRSRILEICAAALGDSGADFVRYAWNEYPGRVNLPSLANSSAACLPLREGVDRVEAALAQLEGHHKRDSMFSLGYFHTHDALDWIERSIFEPITEAWGNLAAASMIDWPRIENWLLRGRPLSLVAIDALLAIADPRSPLLRAYLPSLIHPPTSATFREVLSAYCARDPVPRVQKRIEALLEPSGIARVLKSL
jgi:hypothetical protein